MKKFLILLTTLILFCSNANANPAFRAEMSGFPFVSENNVLANINLNYIKNGLAKLSVMAVEPYISNNENPSIKIPVENLYLLCDGKEFQITNSSQRQFFIDYQNPEGTVQKNINLRLENIGELPAGTYSVLLRFSNKNEAGSDVESEFFFNFIVNDKHIITFLTGDPLIVLSEDDIFNKQSYIRNKSDVRLNIFSNTNWKLWLVTSKLENDDCEYYCQIKNATGKIKSFDRNNIKLLPDKRYLLATGEPTLDGICTGNKTPSDITIEYLFKNTNSDSYIKEGLKHNSFTYILERE